MAQITKNEDRVLQANEYRFLTVADLENFKVDLIRELRELIKGQAQCPEKQWLKSGEVRKLLNLSSGTLQTLRNNGTLPFTRIGGVIYYNSDEILNMLEDNKTNKG
jgi:hypothetical protein